MLKSLMCGFAGLILLISSGAAADSGGHPIDKQHWSFSGLFGRYDQNTLQRGFQIYAEVCAACHSLQYVAYRDLAALGYSEAQIKAFAGNYELTDGPNDEGEYYQRPARPADKFVPPFANEQAARYANNGALPIDLSLIAKSKKHGPDYIYALLTAYQEPPEDFELGEGLYYNTAFAGEQIAMPQPLFDDLTAYQDGHEATIANMAYDVSHFLMWAAEPHLAERKALGFKVILFLLFFCIVLYANKVKIWRKRH